MTELPNKIVLIGFSGSGKSTVGPQLAQKIDYEFADSDDMISEAVGMTISEIFAMFGEPVFREYETAVIKQLMNTNNRLVCAVGGGAMERKELRSHITTKAVTVYLKCSQKLLFERLQGKEDRPLLYDSEKERHLTATELKERIKNLLNKRKKRYESADIIINRNNQTVSRTVSEIKKRIQAYVQN